MPPINWNFWQNQAFTKKEKIYCAIAVSAIVGVIILGCLFEAPSSKKDLVCSTPACLRAAEHVITYLNRSADPCDDFYTFACGGLHEDIIINNKSTFFDIFSWQLNKTVLRDISDYRSDEQNLTKSFRDQRKFYRACMNMSAINADRDRTFLKMMEIVFGKQILKNSSFNYPATNDVNWTKILFDARLNGLKYDYFFKLSHYEVTLKKKAYLQIEPPISPPKKENIWYQNNWAEKYQLLVNLSTHLNLQTDAADKDFNGTRQFADSLNTLIAEAYESLDDIMNGNQEINMTEFRAQANYNSSRSSIGDIDWLTILNGLTGLDLNNEIVVVYGDGYYQKLLQLLDATDEIYWLNYIIFEQLINDCAFLSSPVQNLCQQLTNSSSLKRDREDICAEETFENFPGVFQMEFLSKYLPEESREDIKEMADQIKAVMIEHLRQEKRLSNESIEKAIFNVNRIGLFLGWSDIAYDQVNFEKLFGYKLNLPENVLEARYQLQHRLFDMMFGDIRNRTVPYTFDQLKYFHKYSIGVNAYYHEISHNTIFLVPIIQEPIYALDRPKYLNYGSLGTIIGHEITHGAAKYARNEANDPLLKCTNSIDNACVQEFFDIYYAKHKLKQKNIQYPGTIDEALADYSGVNLAYQAYKKHVERHGPELGLPGVNLTAEQLFWILGSTWSCVSLDWDDPRLEFHPHPTFRLNTPAMHSPFFSKDFGCDSNSTMNVKDKCLIFAH